MGTTTGLVPRLRFSCAPPSSINTRAGGGLCASAESTSHIFPVVSTACSYAEQVMFNLVGFNVGAGIIY